MGHIGHRSYRSTTTACQRVIPCLLAEAGQQAGRGTPSGVLLLLTPLPLTDGGRENQGRSSHLYMYEFSQAFYIPFILHSGVNESMIARQGGRNTVPNQMMGP
jgi:hypothetical protein